MGKPFGGYRFIPLAENFIATPPIGLREISHTNAVGRLSGHIDVTWKNYTPLCVSNKDKEEEENAVSEPFTLGGQYALPGASLRGMLRAVMEIATFSHLGPINAKHRYGFRDFSKYHRKMTEGMKSGWLVYEDGKWSLHRTKQLKNVLLYHKNDICNITSMKIQKWRPLSIINKYEKFKDGGALSKRKFNIRPGYVPANQYFAQEVPTGYEPDADCVTGYVVCSGPGIENIPNEKLHETVFGEREDKPIEDFSRKDVLLLAAMHSNFSKIDYLSPKIDKLWAFWLKQKGYPEPSGGKIDDEKAPITVLEGLKEYPGIPVFYLDKGEKAYGEARFALSLTRAFKFPYFHNVGEIAKRSYSKLPGGESTYRVPKLEERLDFARAVFGDIDVEGANDDTNDKASNKIDLLKGRVFVGFACGPEINDNLIEEGNLFVGEPRPSYLPHYMSRINNSDNKSYITDYSDYGIIFAPKIIRGEKKFVPEGLSLPEKARIAGRKRYPLRLSPSLGFDRAMVQANEDSEGQLSSVNFITGGQEFTGRIRFRNLHPVELGALLWALQFGKALKDGAVDPQYQHALGRGKAYGFGRIGVVKAEMKLDDRCKTTSSDSDQGKVTSDTFIGFFTDHMETCLKKVDEEEVNPLKGSIQKKDAGEAVKPWEDSIQIRMLRAMADPTIGEQNKESLQPIRDFEHFRKGRVERTIPRYVPTDYDAFCD